MINPAGFEIGRYRTNVSPKAVEYFKRLGTWDDAKFGADPQLTMNFVHGDYVPADGMPPELESMGGTALSPHNGLFNRSNILTFQVPGSHHYLAPALCAAESGSAKWAAGGVKGGVGSTFGTGVKPDKSKAGLACGSPLLIPFVRTNHHNV